MDPRREWSTQVDDVGSSRAQSSSNLTSNPTNSQYFNPVWYILCKSVCTSDHKWNTYQHTFTDTDSSLWDVKEKKKSMQLTFYV